jgi:fumarate reductase subunit D
MNRYRNHPLWLAFLLHRLSGLALSVFLPMHFYVLALALTSPERLDGFLHWAELPLVKFAAFGLVFLLAVHFFGGLRLLVVRFRHLAPIFACPRPNVEISRTTSNDKFLVAFLNLTFARRDCGIGDTNVKFTPLALEFLPWSGPQKTLAAGALAGAFMVSGVFLLKAI